MTVFDLDGVIARNDTMEVLVRRMLVRNPLRALLSIPFVALWFFIPSKVAWRGRLSGVLGGIAFSGLSERRYRSIARRVGRELGAQRAWALTSGSELLRAEVASGRNVLVSTGTEYEIARSFLDEIGFPGVELSATTMRFGRWFVRYQNHNLGAMKVRNLGGRNPTLFYTDSTADLPLARVSAATVLVNPDAAVEADFRREIANLSVVRWD